MTDGGRRPRPGVGVLVPVPDREAGERRPAALVRQREGGGDTALVPASLDGRVRSAPFVPVGPFDPRLVFTDQDARRASAFRTLRQRLLDRGDLRVILCTSANSGEGTTTLAANLALSFSELGRFRVLLVEANFRRPAIANLFGFDPPTSFRMQIVRHRVSPEERWAVVEIGPPSLFILANEKNGCPRCAGPLPEGARFCGVCGAEVGADIPPLLDGVAFNAALANLREIFDYIVIDAPSVLLSGDVNLIQDSADAIVLAVRRGHSDQRSLRRAVEQIAPAPLAGVVLFEA